MKYYHCIRCDNVFVGSDIDQQVFCDVCGGNQHLRSIQRMEYNEIIQAKQDGMTYSEYQEWKHHVAMDKLGKIIHENFERKHRMV